MVDQGNSLGLIRLSIIAFVAFCCAPPSYAKYDIDWLNDWMVRQTIHDSFVDIDINAATAEPILQRLHPNQIERSDVTPGRATKQLEENPHSCVGKAIRTPEREKTMLFSRYPQVIYQGYRLYVNGNIPNLEHLNDNHFSLNDLLENKQFTLGIVKDRSYGTAYDALFQRTDLTANIWPRSGRDSGIGLIEMLLNGRVDAIIEHPATMQNYLSQREEKASPSSFKPADTTPFTLGYIACSRSPEGKENMTAINRQHAQVKQQRSYLENQLQWVAPGTRAQFINYYNDVYDTDFVHSSSSVSDIESRP